MRLAAARSRCWPCSPAPAGCRRAAGRSSASPSPRSRRGRGRAADRARARRARRTRAGAPLDAADVRESIAHLFSLGRFEDVRVDAEPERRRRGDPLRAPAAPLGARDRLPRADRARRRARLRARASPSASALAPSRRAAAEVVEFLAAYYRDPGTSGAGIDAAHRPSGTRRTSDAGLRRERRAARRDREGHVDGNAPALADARPPALWICRRAARTTGRRSTRASTSSSPTCASAATTRRRASTRSQLAADGGPATHRHDRRWSARRRRVRGRSAPGNGARSSCRSRAKARRRGPARGLGTPHRGLFPAAGLPRCERDLRGCRRTASCAIIFKVARGPAVRRGPVDDLRQPGDRR